MDASDAINAGLWATLSGDAQLYAFLGSQPAAQSKGVWNRKADDGSPLPLVTFRMLAATYDYSFGGVSCERYPYVVCGFAEETEARGGAETVALLTGHLRRVLTDAEFAVAGYELLLCRPYAGVPPDSKEGENDRTQYKQGVLLEVLVTPA